MTLCRRCQGEIRQRQMGRVQLWVHVKPVSHAALPPVKVAPPSESERRAMAGDR